MKAKVSFVLPAYKGCFFEDALRSILAQSVRDIEVIVLDDCSPDNLHAVIERLGDQRVRYFRNVENLGGKNLVQVWNKALGYATGEWCVLASDDDLYAPTFAEEMLRAAEEQTGVSLFHCRLCMIDEHGKILKISEKRASYETCADLIYARGIKRCLQVAPDFFFSREAIMKLGGFVDFPAAWYSDEATWMSLAKERGCGYVEKVLFYWRTSSENISSKSKNSRQKIKAAQEYFKWSRQFIEQLSPQEEMDAETIKLCKQLLPGAIEQQALFDLNDASLRDWISIILKQKLSKRFLLRAIKGRFLHLLHL